MRNRLKLSLLLLLSGSSLATGTYASFSSNDENIPPRNSRRINTFLLQSPNTTINLLKDQLETVQEEEERARDLALRLAAAADRYQQRTIARSKALVEELNKAHESNTILVAELKKNQFIAGKLEETLKQTHKAKCSLETELERAHREILELKQKLLEGGPAPTQPSQKLDDALKLFMDNFASATVDDKKLQFQTCLELLMQSASQKSAEQALTFLWAQLKVKVRKANGTYTSEEICEINVLNQMTQTLVSTPGLDSLQSVQQKELLSFEQEQDEPSYRMILKDLDTHLNVAHINLKDCDALNAKSPKDRAIPVLLYLLKIDSAALLSMATFDAPKWRHWPSFVRFLILEQRKAVRFHLKQGAFPATMSTTQQKKEAIQVFLESLQRSIDENPPKKPMGQGDVAIFNTQLLGHLKWMMENRPVKGVN